MYVCVYAVLVLLFCVLDQFIGRIEGHLRRNDAMDRHEMVKAVTEKFKANWAPAGSVPVTKHLDRAANISEWLKDNISKQLVNITEFRQFEITLDSTTQEPVVRVRRETGVDDAEQNPWMSMKFEKGQYTQVSKCVLCSVLCLCFCFIVPICI